MRVLCPLLILFFQQSMSVPVILGALHHSPASLLCNVSFPPMRDTPVTTNREWWYFRDTKYRSGRDNERTWRINLCMKPIGIIKGGIFLESSTGLPLYLRTVSLSLHPPFSSSPPFVSHSPSLLPHLPSLFARVSLYARSRRA